MAGEMILPKVLPTDVPTPEPGEVAFFVHLTTGQFSRKDELGAVSPDGPGVATALQLDGATADVSAEPAPAALGDVMVATNLTPLELGLRDPATLPGSFKLDPALKAGTFSVPLGGGVLVDCSAVDAVANLPNASGNRDRVVHVKLAAQAGAFDCTLTPFGAQTVDGDPTLALTIEDEWATLRSDGSNWRVEG